MVKLLSISVLLGFFSMAVGAEELEDHTKLLMDHGDGHLMEMSGGMVMGQNTDKLPGGCDSISETKEVTVHAGHKYAEKFPGRMYAFDTQEFHFKPCTKLTIHFINEDKIRHQWMMHGLPKYLYPKGMFHLEVSGPAMISGTLILPPGDKTYLVHCDIAQHMEKGMKAQLKVGDGDGDLPSIPGLTAPAVTDDYNAGLPEVFAAAKVTELEITAANEALAQAEATKKLAKNAAPSQTDAFMSGTAIIGFAVGLLLALFLAKKFKGMSIIEVVSTIFNLLIAGTKSVGKFMSAVFKRVITTQQPPAKSWWVAYRRTKPPTGREDD
jgi:hypothetical protein